MGFLEMISCVSAGVKKIVGIATIAGSCEQKWEKLFGSFYLPRTTLQEKHLSLSSSLRDSPCRILV